jgi:hypothetical protein
MSTARKKVPYEFPRSEAVDRQEKLRQVKLEVENLKDKLQKSILDNPKIAKKSALLISMWVEGKQKKSSKKQK